MMLRPTRMAAMIGVAALSLAACASGSNSPATSATGQASAGVQFVQKNPLKIGYSVYDMQSPYWQAFAKGVKDEGAAQHAEIVIADQKSSEQKQVSGSSDLINQGVSALIITPVQPAALPATITQAHAAKIPVIIGDIGTAPGYDAYILSDNYGGGKMAAEYLIKKVGAEPGTHKVGVIQLHSGSVVGEQRVAGFVDRIAKESNFKVVSSLDGKDTVEGGFSTTQDMLAANPDLVGIYAANDPEAQGAARALEAAGKYRAGSKFLLVGFNGDSPSLDLIDQGKQTATVAQDPYGQGRLAVKTALALLQKKTPKFTNAADRVIQFPVQVVDAANIAAFRATLAKQG